jgi:hypothetical protein
MPRKPTPPPPSEWDFAKVAAKELEACVCWEYSREIPEFVVGVDLMKKNPDFRLDPNCAGLYHRPTQVDFEEWPGTAFLKLPESVRSVFGPRFIDLREIDPEALSDSIVADGSALITSLLKYVENNSLPVAMRSATLLQELGGDRSQEFAAFVIDWKRSNEELSRCFAEWLDWNRPENIKPIEKRGCSPIRLWRMQLKALGAYRLMTKYKMKPLEAFIHTRGAAGAKGLYSDSFETWSRAKALAKTLIAQMSKDLIFKTSF